MIRYSEVKAIWTSGASTPEGLHMDRIYSIGNKNGKFFITDGNMEYDFDEFCITTFLSPKDKEIDWKDVDFSNETKTSKK